jgi:hypothetical protein
MARRGARELPLVLSQDGETLIAEVRAADPGGRPLTGLAGNLQLTAVTAEGAVGAPQPPVPLVERAAGLYQARTTTGHAAAVLAEARLGQQPGATSGDGLQAQGQLSLPLAPDLTPAAPPDGLATLEGIARRTGGQLLSAPQKREGPGQQRADATKLAELRAPAPAPTPQQVPLRPPLALAALALFLADVASRRANFRAPGPATVQG